eukprot:1561459-Pleurochrysis_carterae.AAC.1
MTNAALLRSCTSSEVISRGGQQDVLALSPHRKEMPAHTPTLHQATPAAAPESSVATTRIVIKEEAAPAAVAKPSMPKHVRADGICDALEPKFKSDPKQGAAKRAAAGWSCAACTYTHEREHVRF